MPNLHVQRVNNLQVMDNNQGDMEQYAKASNSEGHDEVEELKPFVSSLQKKVSRRETKEQKLELGRLQKKEKRGRKKVERNRLKGCVPSRELDSDGKYCDWCFEDMACRVSYFYI